MDASIRRCPLLLGIGLGFGLGLGLGSGLGLGLGLGLDLGIRVGYVAECGGDPRYLVITPRQRAGAPRFELPLAEEGGSGGGGARAGAGGGARNCRGEIGRNAPARISLKDDTQARPEASVRVWGTTTVRAHRPNLKIWAVRSTAAPLLAPNPPSCRRWQTAGLEVDCGLSALPPRRFRVVTLLNVRHPASLGPGRAQTPLAVPRQ